jgi:hypothetical protein
MSLLVTKLGKAIIETVIKTIIAVMIAYLAELVIAKTSSKKTK